MSILFHVEILDLSLGSLTRKKKTQQTRKIIEEVKEQKPKEQKKRETDEEKRNREKRRKKRNERKKVETIK